MIQDRGILAGGAHGGPCAECGCHACAEQRQRKSDVTGESVAPVDLNDAQIGNMVTSEQINSLPLVLRDPYQLALLSPGANASNSILGGLSVNGARERNNNFLLDGTDNNDADIPGLTL